MCTRGAQRFETIMCICQGKEPSIVRRNYLFLTPVGLISLWMASLGILHDCWQQGQIILSTDVQSCNFTAYYYLFHRFQDIKIRYGYILIVFFFNRFSIISIKTEKRSTQTIKVEKLHSLCTHWFYGRSWNILMINKSLGSIC